MNIFRQLTDKSWAVEGPLDELPGAYESSVSTAKTGLWMFLGVVASLFGLFISAYHMRAEYADWLTVEVPAVLWLNTAILVLASGAYAWAKSAAGKADTSRLRAGVTIAGVLTLLFLGGQYLAWQQMLAAGNYAAGNASYAFFYLLTGLHALHMLGGLWVWARSAIAAWRGFDDSDVDEVARVRLSVELCSTYWTFLLFVWLVLFGLLLTT